MGVWVNPYTLISYPYLLCVLCVFAVNNYMARAKGFFTDTTVCIGCKACQVACREWNQDKLPDAFEHVHQHPPQLLGTSYDNTGHLSAVNWRHVKFIEQFSEDRIQQSRWLMMSDCCKHCVNAPCVDVCPTGSLIRTEFDSVYIQDEVCNGCRDCIAACPFGVISFGEWDGKVHKCTLCYDRLQAGLQPACAQACPTQSIQFGDVDELIERAKKRVEVLHERGVKNAYLYGQGTGEYGEKILQDSRTGKGGLNVFYLLEDKPEVYGLPPSPQIPHKTVFASSVFSIVAALLVGLAGIFSFRERGMRSSKN